MPSLELGTIGIKRSHYGVSRVTRRCRRSAPSCSYWPTGSIVWPNGSKRGIASALQPIDLTLDTRRWCMVRVEPAEQVVFERQCFTLRTVTPGGVQDG